MSYSLIFHNQEENEISLNDWKIFPASDICCCRQGTIIKLYDEKNSNVVLVLHKLLFDCNFSIAPFSCLMIEKQLFSHKIGPYIWNVLPCKLFRNKCEIQKSSQKWWSDNYSMVKNGGPFFCNQLHCNSTTLYNREL